ncbi:hypothetical protein [Comamonas sp. 17RB]|uniref:hypothetical protein n=1 Tax=Comamonas sp. 17RB TaxID=3047025 RepID=UPI0024B69B41|nr:hypothetical protein [Comamonas sp. 17RB]MDI9853844.1 hypothetical protein [Comamonas sp. 17RB]
MNTTPSPPHTAPRPHRPPAALRASLFLALLLWLSISAFALAAAAAIVLGHS